MSQDFMKSKLPEIITKNNQEKIFDPIRKRFFKVKPEELVRQHLISYLIENLQVPKNLICVEEHLSHYGIDSNERADIIINYEEDTTKYPLVVIECKAPEIFLNDKAREQMFGYAEKLGNNYCWLTNGEENYFYYLDEDGYIEIGELPNYCEMLGGKYSPVPVEEFESRLSLDELEENYLKYVNEESIGSETPKNLAIPITNFLECLLDTEHKFPAKQYKLFKVIEDYGVRDLTVGTNGGNFFGSYRSFLINYNDFTNFVSLSVLNYAFEGTKTIIGVAIDKDNKNPHHALQLNVDKNIETYDNKIRFLHDGSITKAKGRLPTDGLRKLVSEKYPEIIRDKKFYFGTLINNRLWYLDDPEVIQVIENLISYALIRDDYREICS